MGGVSTPVRDADADPEAEPDLVGSSAAGPAALRGSVLRGGGYAATLALSLVSAPLLIRHLGIAAFGRYTTVLAIVTMVSGLTDAGLVNIALREWAMHRGEDRSRLMRSLLGIRIELSLAGVAIGVAFALVAGYPSVMVVGTLVAGVGMTLQVLANVLTVALQGELRFGWASIIDVARQLVTVALIVVLVLVGAGLLPFFAVAIPAGLVTLAFTAVLVRGRMPLSPRLRGAERWPLVRDTLPYAAAIAVNTIYFRVTIIVMSLIATAQQTGYFATSFRVIEVLIGVPGLAIGTAFPILARAALGDDERFAYATERIIDLALIAGVGVVLVVDLSAPLVIRFLAGASGAPAVPVLRIQGLALLSTFLATASGFPLLSLRRHSALLIANSAALAANVVLALVLVPIDHARGAAIAAVIAESCLAVGQLVLLLRTGRARIHARAVASVVIAGLAGASPLLVGGAGSVLRTVAGLAIYAAVITLLGRLPPELAHAFERRRP
jgi:O-antigen/teichoic acid export membrane protein